jgi:hypothetical protein
VRRRIVSGGTSGLQIRVGPSDGPWWVRLPSSSAIRPCSSSPYPSTGPAEPLPYPRSAPCARPRPATPVRAEWRNRIGFEGARNGRHSPHCSEDPLLGIGPARDPFLHSTAVRGSIIGCSHEKIGNLGVLARWRSAICWQMTRVLLLTACGCLAVVVLTTYRRSWHCCLAWAGAYRPAPDTTLLVSAVAGGALLLLAGVLWLVRRDGAVDAPQPARVAAPTR